MRASNLLVPTALALTVVAGCGPQDQELSYSRARAGARLGRAIEIEGPVALVGAPYDRDAHDDSQGALYAYIRRGDIWSPAARVVSPHPESNEQFGASVSASGNLVAIGAPRSERSGVQDAGVVYVFSVIDASTWTLEAALVAPTPQSGELLGTDVAIDGDRLVVGAPRYDHGGATDAGRVLVFRRASGTWSHERTLTASSPDTSDRLGESVAIEGSTLLAGAPGRDVRASDTGAVYVHRRGSAGWTLAQLLPGAYASDRFGTDVAIGSDPDDGTLRAVVGAPGARMPGGEAVGAVSVLRWASLTGFVLEQALFCGEAHAGMRCGDSVSIDGALVAVGAPGARSPRLPFDEHGSVHVLSRRGSDWTEVGMLTTRGSRALGDAVAVGGEHVLVGAPDELVAAGRTLAGAVHAFDASSGSWSHRARLVAASDLVDVGQVTYGQGFAASDERVVVLGRDGADVYRREGAAWSLAQVIEPTEPALFAATSIDGARVALVSRRPGQGGVPEVRVRVHEEVSSGLLAQVAELTPDFATQVMPATDHMVVTLSGDTLVLAAPRWNGGRGRVFVWRESGGTWAQTQILDSPVPGINTDANYGRSAWLFDDRLVVVESPQLAPLIGRVFVYQLGSGGQYALTQEITGSMAFGRVAALDAGLLVLTDTPTALRTYRWTGDQFEPRWTGTLPHSASSLALRGDLLAVGHQEASYDGLTDAGEVALYERQADDSLALTSTLRASGARDQQWLGFRVALTSEQVIASVRLDVGRVHCFDL